MNKYLNKYYKVDWSKVIFVKQRYDLTNKQFGNLVGVSESLVSGWIYNRTNKTNPETYRKLMFLFKHSCSHFKWLFKFLVRFV